MNIVVQFKQHGALFIIADHRWIHINDATRTPRVTGVTQCSCWRDTTPDRLPGVLPDVARSVINDQFAAVVAFWIA